MRRDCLWPVVAGLLLVFALGGCRESVEESPPPEALPPPAAVVASPLGTVPGHWRMGLAVGGRLASYRILAADGRVAEVSLVQEPSFDMRSMLQTVNLWRHQFGLPATNDGEIEHSVRSLPGWPGTVWYFDLEEAMEGPNRLFDGRLLAAIAERPDGAWVFRLRGNPGLVSQNEAAFLAWVVSVFPEQEATPAEEASAEPTPASGGWAGMFSHEPGLAVEISWNAPQGWGPLPDAQGKLICYAVEREEGSAAHIGIWGRADEAAVGAPQVNAWRAKVGLGSLPPQAPTVPESIWSGGRQFHVFDFEGTEERLVVAWTQGPHALWFFSLKAPQSTAQAVVPEFAALLHSVNFRSGKAPD